MRCDCGGGTAGYLHTESVIEFGMLECGGNIFVIWQQFWWKILKQGRTAMNTSER